MLAINNLSIQFGDKHLFRDISARVHPTDRIGLIGANGAGKSTLLKIMAGTKIVDSGVLTRSKRATVGYLAQEIASFPPGRTLYEEAETAFAKDLALQRELESVNQRLAETASSAPDFENLLARQGELQHRLDMSDIFTMQSQIEKVLTGLGFRQADFARDCHSFSGGWLMRLMLAKLLLAKPSLLLLDEPTNHLDIESLTWIEDFLKGSQGAFILISHDRTFLDNVTTTTWELSLGSLTVYKGNYSKYLEDKEERLAVKRAAYENQQAKIQQTMRFVERFRAKSTKASQVQSRLKQLEKMELIELDDSEQQVSFRFPPAPPSGRLAIEVTNLAKSFQAHQVFQNLSFSLQRGEKMAILGVNGAGKSTLVRLLAGLYKRDQGEIRLGHNVKLSYFGQHQAQELDPRSSVLDTVYHATQEMTVTQVRSLLGAFLFRGDEVDKKVEVLSGGEKSRLALAKMIATPANLLILDEPTNHLDIASQEVLQEAMRQYDGAVIVVSHNRSFANAFVGKVLEIKHGQAALFEGNINDYLAKTRKTLEAASASSRPPPAGEEKTAQPLKSKKGKAARQEQARLRQQRNEKLTPLKKRLAAMENDIEALEETMKELEQRLADPELYKDQDAFADINREYGKAKAGLDKKYHDWSAVQERIEEIEARFPF